MKNSNLLNLMLAILLSMVATTTNAQLEVKVDPLDVLFNSPKVSAEYVVNDEIGVELLMGFKYGKQIINGGGQENSSVRAIGKYYFKPKSKADGFYTGLYAGSKRLNVNIDYVIEGSIIDQLIEVDRKEDIFTAGITAGYKWVGKTGIMFELAAGFGRVFSDIPSDYISNVDGFGRITFGYRF